MEINYHVVLETRSKYFAGGCIYLGLRNQINAAIMRMRTLKFRNTCACIYPTEIYFIMAVCEYSLKKIDQ